MDLQEFRSRLDRGTGAVSLDELTLLLEALEVAPEDVAEWTHFGEDDYRRNPMFGGAAYEALCICWRPGQRTPIHDHLGSGCGIRVVRGTLTEHPFDRTPEGDLVPQASCVIPEGGICVSHDRDIHEVVNESPDEPTITIHVYSPRLSRVGTYTLGSREVIPFEVTEHPASEPLSVD